ncbi:hypothetical protein EW146_g5864 [Bondarzewia mesenterica]|uniref:Uncharacterized protein n=1 Tax=Bondarzewia mesenterica TaxID=1095465 RepID=A0A4S4LQA0_9AGAM|nr:hypothetical protein EW146_g5864 [Bondarzewia mesenterica]
MVKMSATTVITASPSVSNVQPSNSGSVISLSTRPTALAPGLLVASAATTIQDTISVTFPITTWTLRRSRVFLPTPTTTSQHIRRRVWFNRRPRSRRIPPDRGTIEAWIQHLVNVNVNPAITEH